MASLQVVPTKHQEPAAPAPATMTLFQVEEHLAALTETMAMVLPEREEEFLADFESALMAAKDKRDRVQGFLVHMESEAAKVGLEIARLRHRQETFAIAAERVERMVTGIIERMGRDEKGKWQKLEGNFVTFQLHACPPSVEIDTDAALPPVYKFVSVKLRQDIWEQLLDSVDFDLREHVLNECAPQVAVSKSAVSDALKAAIGPEKIKEAVKDGESRLSVESIPGACLKVGAHTLQRK